MCVVQGLNRGVYREYVHRILSSHSLDFSFPGLLQPFPVVESAVADPNSVLLQVFYESFSQPAKCQLQPVIWLKAVKMENTFHAVSSKSVSSFSESA